MSCRMKGKEVTRAFDGGVTNQVGGLPKRCCYDRVHTRLAR
jgi:hypothetical protein